MNMDENSFAFPTDRLLADRFPARPTVSARRARPQTDLDWLAGGTDFGRHAWDEGGRP